MFSSFKASQYKYNVKYNQALTTELLKKLIAPNELLIMPIYVYNLIFLQCVSFLPIGVMFTAQIIHAISSFAELLINSMNWVA